MDTSLSKRLPWRLLSVLTGSLLVAGTAGAMTGALDLPVLGPLFVQTERVESTPLERGALAVGSLIALIFISRRRHPGRL